jgi:hypothetical protein
VGSSLRHSCEASSRASHRTLEGECASLLVASERYDLKTGDGIREWLENLQGVSDMHMPSSWWLKILEADLVEITCPDCGLVKVEGDTFEGGRAISGECPQCGERLYFA